MVNEVDRLGPKLRIKMSAFRRYNSSEARQIMEDLPSDDAMTDEEPSEDEAEPQHDMFDEDFVPVGTFGHVNHDDDTDDEGSTTSDDRPGSSGAASTRRQAPEHISRRKTDVSEKEHIFQGSEGPIQAEFEKFERPIDVFMTYLDDSLDNILEQSNLYKTQQQRNHIAAITKSEMLGFIGINVLMGYHRLPAWGHYWCPDPDLGLPLVSETMTMNRFAQILSNLHINDNMAMPNNNRDKLYKLRPFIDTMNATFVKLYNVSRVLSVDESMILFKVKEEAQ